MSPKIRGSGDASAEATFDRTVKEAVRQAKLHAKNDPNFVPAPNDLSNILAARAFLPATFQAPQRPISDAGLLLAASVFTNRTQPPALTSPYLTAPRIANGLVMLGTATAAVIPGRISLTATATGAALAAGDIARSATNGLTVTSVTGSAYDFVLTGPGAAVILRVPTGTVNLEALGTFKVTGAFGCNGSAPQGAAALGAALNAYVGGAFGLSAAADMQALVVQVQAITAALKAIGIGV